MITRRSGKFVQKHCFISFQTQTVHEDDSRFGTSTELFLKWNGGLKKGVHDVANQFFKWINMHGSWMFNLTCNTTNTKLINLQRQTLTNQTLTGYFTAIGTWRSQPILQTCELICMLMNDWVNNWTHSGAHFKCQSMRRECILQYRQVHAGIL